MLAVLLNVTFSWEKFLLGYAVLMPAHLSVSYSNDYFDVEVDSLGQPTTFAGGSGVLVKNPELRPFAKSFAQLLIVTSLTLALVFTFLFSSPTFLVMAVFGNFLAWFYSAPPLKLAYRGLGEISTILTGFVIPGLGFVSLSGSLDLNFFMFSIPLMIYMLFFILSVEIPDKEGDEQGGKNTFIVTHGREAGFAIIGLAAVMGTLTFLFLSFTGIYSAIDLRVVALLSLIPLACGMWVFLKRTSEKVQAIRLIGYTVPALVLFIALVDLYFLGLLLWPAL
jgi:1,4-dihydroxy-2-naphthoate octaprenyltransferase